MDQEGNPLDEQYQPLDPNAPVMRLNCITSPSTFLKFQDRQQRNVLHSAALTNQGDQLVPKLFDLIKQMKIVNTLYDESDHPKQKSEPKDLIQSMLLARDSNQFTPLEVAIGNGVTSLAELYLSNKGIDVRIKSQEKDDYEGLDVGGKKMDWAKEHQAPQKQKYDGSAFHIAVFYGKRNANLLLVFFC